MKKIEHLTTSCRSCRFYRTEGRRGGNCELLNVLVKGEWKACQLAQHPFENQWDSLDPILHLEKTLSLDCVESMREEESQRVTVN